MLTIDAISAGYGSAPQVLHDVSFTLSAGSCTALIGANGAGKSTLNAVLCGLLPVRSGRLYLDGRDITQWTPAERVRAGLALVPEGRRVFPRMSVYENMCMGVVACNGQRFSHNLAKMYDLFPILEKRASARAGTLSGGEQQMLALARALMSEPRILLLDEPSLGLAPLVVQQLFQIIVQLRQCGTTVLLSEQNAAAALKIADIGIVMSGGMVRRQEPAGQLLADPSVREAYLGAD